MEDYEQCEKQLMQLYKLTDDVKEKDSINFYITICGDCRRYQQDMGGRVFRRKEIE
jgi:hypothetical protein